MGNVRRLSLLPRRNCQILLLIKSFLPAQIIERVGQGENHWITSKTFLYFLQFRGSKISYYFMFNAFSIYLEYIQNLHFLFDDVDFVQNNIFREQGDSCTLEQARIQKNIMERYTGCILEFSMMWLYMSAEGRAKWFI